MPDEMVEYMNSAWPKALAKLRSEVTFSGSAEMAQLKARLTEGRHHNQYQSHPED
ncbi:MAG: hypothetical protein HZB47_05250 [Nitrosomonadales bacterium]|nr:hypothetical protein [Nitrosomonadales bacterium]